MHCRMLSLALCLVAVGAALPPPVAAAPAAAQSPYTAGSEARPHYDTGDAWIDARLADIDRYATHYPEAFAAEVERYAGQPRAYVQGLVAQPGWNAGDAWYACFLARALDSACRTVVRTRARLGEAGSWSAALEALRGEDGPDTAIPLRLALADSYRRWDRTLEPDATLRRALQQREREAAAAAPTR